MKHSKQCVNLLIKLNTQQQPTYLFAYLLLSLSLSLSLSFAPDACHGPSRVLISYGAVTRLRNDADRRW